MQKKRSQRELELLVEIWNLKNAPGCKVVVTLDSGATRDDETETPAYLLSGHSPVVYLRGLRCYSLDRVKAVA